MLCAESPLVELISFPQIFEISDEAIKKRSQDFPSKLAEIIKIKISEIITRYGLEIDWSLEKMRKLNLNRNALTEVEELTE